MSPVQVEKRSVSKARRESVIEGQGGVCKRSYCGATAVEVDHILPLWAGGSNANDNLEGLCADCHKQKTVAETKARAKAKRIVARLTGTRRPRKPIPYRANAWPPKGSMKIPTKKQMRALKAAANDQETQHDQ